MDSFTSDIGCTAAGAASASVQTAGTMSTDSIVSSSTSSSNENNRPHRRRASSLSFLSSSSEESLASQIKMEEPTENPEGKHMLRFKKRLMIKVNADGEKALVCEEAREKSNDKKRRLSEDSSEENIGHRHKKRRHSNEQISIHHLLSLANQRMLQAQSSLTLAQLKQRARDKAKANAKPSRRVQPKRKRRGGKAQPAKKSPPTSEESGVEEPMEKIEMNTGILYLYRGERRRAEFVRRR